MKLFNYLRPVLSFSHAMSIHWFAQIYWLAKICICHKTHPTRDEMSDLQIAPPRTLMLPFFSILLALRTQDTVMLVLNFEVGHFTCHFLLLPCFLPSFLPFGVAMKGIHSTQLRCHISFLLFVWLTTCFLSSRGRLLDSHKHRLFCLHIQHATHCLFE